MMETGGFADFFVSRAAAPDLPIDWDCGHKHGGSEAAFQAAIETSSRTSQGVAA
jgi:hypothetical protein